MKIAQSVLSKLRFAFCNDINQQRGLGVLRLRKSNIKPAYYVDNIQERDALLKEIYQEIDLGIRWQDAIRKPAVTKHGERIAEYAYLASIFKQLCPVSIMDVGCVLNNPIFSGRIDAHCRIHFLNPSLEPVIYREYAYFKMPLDAWAEQMRFPLVTCLSTIEHIGFDNTRYGVDETDQGWDWSRCISETCSNVWRLLSLTAAGGLLIISCPFGRKEFVHHPPVVGVRTAQVLHTEHIAALRSQPFGHKLEIITLRLCSTGWEICDPDAEYAAYGSIGPGASGLILICAKGEEK